jgi:hypothetical protein
MRFQLFTFMRNTAMPIRRYATYCNPGPIEGPRAGPLGPLATFGCSREESEAAMVRKLLGLLDEVTADGEIFIREIELQPTGKVQTDVENSGTKR